MVRRWPGLDSCPWSTAACLSLSLSHDFLSNSLYDEYKYICINPSKIKLCSSAPFAATVHSAWPRRLYTPRGQRCDGLPAELRRASSGRTRGRKHLAERGQKESVSKLRLIRETWLACGEPTGVACVVFCCESRGKVEMKKKENSLHVCQLQVWGFQGGGWHDGNPGGLHLHFLQNSLLVWALGVKVSNIKKSERVWSPI